MDGWNAFVWRDVVAMSTVVGFWGVGLVQSAHAQSHGTVDPGFDAELAATGIIERLIVQDDGKLVVSGTVAIEGDRKMVSIVRLLPDGRVDPTFQRYNFGQRSGVEIQPDGRLLRAAERNVNLVRLNPDGSVDPTFNASDIGTETSNQATINAIGLQPDGKVLLAGWNLLTEAGGSKLVRLEADGRVDASFPIEGDFRQLRTVMDILGNTTCHQSRRPLRLRNLGL